MNKTKSIIFMVIVVIIICFCMTVSVHAGNDNKNSDDNGIVLVSVTTPEQESILGYKIRVVKILGKHVVIIERNVMSRNQNISVSVSTTVLD